MFSNAEPLLPNSYPVIKASIVSPNEKVISPLTSSNVSKALKDDWELNALSESDKDLLHLTQPLKFLVVSGTYTPSNRLATVPSNPKLIKCL